MEYPDCRTCDYFAVLFGCKRSYSVRVFVVESDWVFVDDWGGGDFRTVYEKRENIEPSISNFCFLNFTSNHYKILKPIFKR